MAPLPLAVGQPRHREQIRMFEERHAVLERQPLAPVELSRNFVEHMRIVS